MIVVAGTMTVEPAHCERARGLLATVAQATRRESGCVLYAISTDLERPERFRIIEEWRTQTELDAHLATPHVAAFIAALADLRVIAMSVDHYRVSSKAKLL